MLANAISNGGIGPRVIAAALLIPLTIGLTWVGGWPFALLILACAGLIAREWSRLCGSQPGSLATLALVLGVLAIIASATALNRFEAGIIACLLLYLILRLLPAAGRTHHSKVWLAAGALTIIPAGLSLIWLRSVPPDGLTLVVWLFVVVWTTDTAAFAVGKTIGGPRLAPAISPKKTWAGFIGGVLGATAVSVAFAYAISGQAQGMAAVAGLAIALAASGGDLFESYVKRRFNAKDSGGLIPGHGGFLDRLDSLLAAAPVAACLYLVGWRWL